MVASLLAWPGGSIITVPVLVYLLGQDEKTAIAGSLLLVTALGIVGSFGGAKIANLTPQDKLKKGFGYFLVVMGIYILARSTPQLLELAT